MSVCAFIYNTNIQQSAWHVYKGRKIHTTSNIYTCGIAHGFHAIQMIMNTVQINSKHKCKW